MAIPKQFSPSQAVLDEVATMGLRLTEGISAVRYNVGTTGVEQFIGFEVIPQGGRQLFEAQDRTLWLPVVLATNGKTVDTNDGDKIRLLTVMNHALVNVMTEWVIVEKTDLADIAAEFGDG